MTITKEQAKEMALAAMPLIRWLEDNCHPHCIALVTSTDIELMEGLAKELRYDKPD